MQIKDVKVGQKVIIDPAILLKNSGYIAAEPLIATIADMSGYLCEIAWEETEKKQVDSISAKSFPQFPKLTKGIGVYKTLEVELYKEKKAKKDSAPLLLGLMIAGMGLSAMGQGKMKEEKRNNAR